MSEQSVVGVAIQVAARRALALDQLATERLVEVDSVWAEYYESLDGELP